MADTTEQHNRPKWQVEHVRTLTELPTDLVKGRAYFVSQENYLIIDHGDGLGPQVYGNRPGLQGPPGVPVPEMLSDDEQLSKAIIITARALYETQEANIERFKDIESMLAGLLAVCAQNLNINLDEVRQAAENERNGN